MNLYNINYISSVVKLFIKLIIPSAIHVARVYSADSMNSPAAMALVISSRVVKWYSVIDNLITKINGVL